MVKNQIAIVIPAYKSIFLDETLFSIFKQTDSNFRIYIGDDSSPDDIKSIVNKYSCLMDIKYKRFDKNVGKISPSLHWNRCISMVKREKWIWLFSDDDLMSKNCIKNLRLSINNSNNKIFRFNSLKFQNDGDVLKENILPNHCTISEFLKLKFTEAIETYAIELVFHKDIFFSTGGFSSYPLGWCSDDLFWVELRLASDFCTIYNSNVFWRYSEYNISGKQNSYADSKNKLKSCFFYLRRLKKLFLFRNNFNIEYLAFVWFQNQFKYLSKGMPITFNILYFKYLLQVFSMRKILIFRKLMSKKVK